MRHAVPEATCFALAQASFDPPGLSVAVKKDRAAEPLLTIGAKFNVNILAAGKEKAVMKQLLKRFKPGEDRFAGLDVQVGAGATGMLIISDYLGEASLFGLVGSIFPG